MRRIPRKRKALILLVRRFHGLTIIEVLIALVIISTVFLGVAKAYLMLGHQHASLQTQDQVMEIMAELFQRSLRNPEAVYFHPDFWNGAYVVQAPRDCTKGQGCSTQALRDYDLAWAQTEFRDLVRDLESSAFQIRPCGISRRSCLSVGAESDFLLPIVPSQPEPLQIGKKSLGVMP